MLQKAKEMQINIMQRKSKELQYGYREKADKVIQDITETAAEFGVALKDLSVKTNYESSYGDTQGVIELSANLTLPDKDIERAIKRQEELTELNKALKRRQYETLKKEFETELKAEQSDV